MTKPIFALEITNESLKLLQGFEDNGQVYVIYTKVFPLSHDIIENGNIKERKKLVEALKEIASIHDEEKKLFLKVDEVVLILPPYGLEVFENEQLTTIVSTEGRIDRIDIKNLYALFLNQPLPSEQNSVFIDIIPERFEVDNISKFDLPPIGQIGTSLKLYAKVHSLPLSLVESYRNAVLEAGIGVSRLVVAPFCALEMLLEQKDIPPSYFLVDVGSDTTTVSLIGEGKLYSSSFFDWGGKTITRHLMNSFAILEAEAEKLKCDYGLEERMMAFKIQVITNREGKSFAINDVVEIVKQELENFTNHLNVTLEVLMKNYDSTYKSLPLVVIGDTSLLNGMHDYLPRRVDSSQVIFPLPLSLGARRPGLYNLLGAIKVQAKYKNINEDAHPMYVFSHKQSFISEAKEKKHE